MATRWKTNLWLCSDKNCSIIDKRYFDWFSAKNVLDTKIITCVYNVCIYTRDIYICAYVDTRVRIAFVLKVLYIYCITARVFANAVGLYYIHFSVWKTSGELFLIPHGVVTKFRHVFFFQSPGVFYLKCSEPYFKNVVFILRRLFSKMKFTF